MLVNIEDEIVFQAENDLFNESKTQIIVFKGMTKTLSVTQSRKFLSYCFEYCGITGLSIQTLRFKSLGRDVKNDTTISQSCNISVSHKAEFEIEPPNSLKSSLKSMIITGMYSDLVIKIRDTNIPVHKCILTVRSLKFDKMISKNPESEILDISDELSDGELEVFKEMLNFVYSGEIIFPDDIDKIFQMLLLAQKFEVPDFKEMCEEEVVHKLDGKNLLRMLILFEKCKIISEEGLFKTRAKFIQNIDIICGENPDLEEQLAKVDGVVRNLLLHFGSGSKRKHLKRKVTFSDFD